MVDSTKPDKPLTYPERKKVNVYKRCEECGNQFITSIYKPANFCSNTCWQRDYKRRIKLQ